MSSTNGNGIESNSTNTRDRPHQNTNSSNTKNRTTQPNIPQKTSTSENNTTTDRIQAEREKRERCKESRRINYLKHKNDPKKHLSELTYGKYNGFDFTSTLLPKPCNPITPHSNIQEKQNGQSGQFNERELTGKRLFNSTTKTSNHRAVNQPETNYFKSYEVPKPPRKKKTIHNPYSKALPSDAHQKSPPKPINKNAQRDLGPSNQEGIENDGDVTGEPTMWQTSPTSNNKNQKNAAITSNEDSTEEKDYTSPPDSQEHL